MFSFTTYDTSSTDVTLDVVLAVCLDEFEVLHLINKQQMKKTVVLTYSL